MSSSSSSSPLNDTNRLAGFQEASDVTVNKVLVAKIESLRGKFPSFEDESSNSDSYYFNQRHRSSSTSAKDASSDASTSTHHIATPHNMEYSRFVLDGNKEVVLVDTVRGPNITSISRAFVRAGPRKMLHFDPSQVTAAIVTCGGLCPGLNNVVRELVHALHNLYQVQKVYGITGGFNGFHNPDYEPILLTNERVRDIHREGGSMLTTSRGGLDIDKTLKFLQDKNISQLYVIGGDGSHRGAYKIYEACMKEALNISVCGKEWAVVSFATLLLPDDKILR